MIDHQIFELGDIDVQSGLRIRGAKLAYKTYGNLNAAKDNVIVFPTFFGSQHPANEPMIGLMSMAQSHYRTTAGTLIQLNTPDRFRSRVTSLASYGQGFVFPFSILVGILAEFSGVVTAIIVLGLIGLVLSTFFTIRLGSVREEP